MTIQFTDKQTGEIHNQLIRGFTYEIPYSVYVSLPESRKEFVHKTALTYCLKCNTFIMPSDDVLSRVAENGDFFDTVAKSCCGELIAC